MSGTVTEKNPNKSMLGFSIVRHNPEKRYKYRVFVTFFRKDHPKFLSKLWGNKAFYYNLLIFEVCLDNNATTPVAPEVSEKIFHFLKSYGNSSSLHRRGIDSGRTINEARRCFSALLHAKPKSKKLFLPSGGGWVVGRESVNLSVKGVIEATE